MAGTANYELLPTNYNRVKMNGYVRKIKIIHNKNKKKKKKTKKIKITIQNQQQSEGQEKRILKRIITMIYLMTIPNRKKLTRNKRRILNQNQEDQKRHKMLKIHRRKKRCKEDEEKKI